MTDFSLSVLQAGESRERPRVLWNYELLVADPDYVADFEKDPISSMIPPRTSKRSASYGARRISTCVDIRFTTTRSVEREEHGDGKCDESVCMVMNVTSSFDGF